MSPDEKDKAFEEQLRGACDSSDRKEARKEMRSRLSVVPFPGIQHVRHSGKVALPDVQSCLSGLVVSVFVYWRRQSAEMRLDFANSLLEASFDLRHCLALANIASLIEVVKIGAQFLQQFLGKSVTHRSLILHLGQCGCKVTRFWNIEVGFPSVFRIEC